MRHRAKSLPECIRDFLTPAVWKQARQASNRRKKPRWDVHPLCFVLLAMTWCCGDSLPEKFETTRGFYVACHPKRRRPGETFQGFQQALERLPMGVLRRMGEGMRGRIERLFGSRLLVDGFIPLGCDGSRLECPRSEELEKRIGTSGKCKKKRKDKGYKKAAAPTLWITVVVHFLTNSLPTQYSRGRTRPCTRLGRPWIRRKPSASVWLYDPPPSIVAMPSS